MLSGHVAGEARLRGLDSTLGAGHSKGCLPPDLVMIRAPKGNSQREHNEPANRDLPRHALPPYCGMADRFITCTTCHSPIPLTQALPAGRRHPHGGGAGAGPRGSGQESRAADRAGHRLLRDQLAEQSRRLVEPCEQELAVRRRERELASAKTSRQLADMRRQIEDPRRIKSLPPCGASSLAAPPRPRFPRAARAG